MNNQQRASSNEQPATSIEQPAFDLFLSHAEGDAAWAAQLASRLREMGLQVKLEEQQAHVSAFHRMKALAAALSQCRRAALVITPEYARDHDRWTAVERHFITQLNVTGRREYLVPLLLADHLPPFLHPFKYLDFRHATAYEACLQQLIEMLLCALQDDALGTGADIENLIPAPGQLPPHSHLPFNWNPHFTGGEEDLQRLHFMLNEDDQFVAVCSAPRGTFPTRRGGVGKTELALAYVFRYGRYYPGGVFWMSAPQREHFRLGLAALAGAAKIKLPANLPEDERLRLIFAGLTGARPALLVLDEVDDPAVWRQCRHAEKNVHVLITTPRTFLLGVSQLNLAGPDQEAALALLFSRRKDLQQAGESGRARGEDLCARFDHSPLAIELAACYLGRHPHLALEDYLQQLEQAEAQQALVEPGHILRRTTASSHRGVALAFELSFHELAKAPEAMRLFWAACQFAPAPIPSKLLNQVAHFDEAGKTFDDACHVLLDLALCQPASDGSLCLHALLRDLGLQAMPRPHADQLRERFIDAMSEFIQRPAGGTLAGELGAEAAHVLHAAELMMQQKHGPAERAGEILKACGDYLQGRNDLEGSLLFYGEALDHVKKRCGRKHKLNAALMSTVAAVLRQQRKLLEAEKWYRRALAVDKKVYGPESAEVAHDLKELGAMLLDSGDWKGAQACLRRSEGIQAKPSAPVQAS